MKIIGGSFGIKGSAFVAGSKLIIESSQKASYGSDQIADVIGRSESARGFGFIGAIIGSAMLGVLGAMLAGPLGLVIGIFIAIAGSFYSSKRLIAEVRMKDGKALTVECTGRAMDKLVKLSST